MVMCCQDGWCQLGGGGGNGMVLVGVGDVGDGHGDGRCHGRRSHSVTR